MTAAGALVKLEKVGKRYWMADGVPPLEVLRDVDLEIAPGETLAIIGPSGSGKSTLLNLIGSLDRPDYGRVIFEGRDLADFDSKELARLRNQRIGFVFQSHYLLPQCTVLENVLTPTLAFQDKANRANAVQRAKQLLEKVGLGNRLEHRPGQLSGGERQRVAVVRALINRPPLLLADEPTGALDHASATGLGQLLVDLNHDENVALVVVTHSIELAQRMSRLLELRDGRLQTRS
jgi:ABC-type lipoprotein export system ATPase subunit